jgi:hypothetical protein
MTPPFATTGDFPRIQRVEALAFHDSAGRIRHMHHFILLEGAEPRPYQVMLDEVTTQVLALGTDLRNLKVLHVTTPFNVATQHKVDVKKGVLVELPPPTRSRGSRVGAPKKKPAAGARRRKR